MVSIAYIDDDENELYVARDEGFNCYHPDDYIVAIRDNDIIVTDLMLGSQDILESIVVASADKPLLITSGLPELREFYRVEQFPFSPKPITMQGALDALGR